MISTVLNFLLFGIILLSYYLKKKRVDVPFMLILLYAIIALMGVFYFPDFSLNRQIELWPFIFLALTCYLYFNPIIKAKGVYNYSSDVKISTGLKLMFVLYILCAIIKIGGDFTFVKNAIVGGDWLMMKADLYNGLSIGNRNGIIAYLANLYVSVFMHAILIYSMYTFTKEDISILKSMFLLLIALTPYIMECILYVYRGGLLTISYLTLMIFLLYYKKMVSKKRRVLIIGLSIVASLILVLTLAISLSRFGESDAGGSIVSYLGQSMLVFNAGIATPISSYANGRYFFLNFLGLDKSDVWIDSRYNISTSDGSALNTFIGCSYVDFGPVLTIIIAIVISCLLSQLFKRRPIVFADLYLFAFYLDFLILGVFHCTEGFALRIFMATALYVVLRFMGRIKFNSYNF